MDNRKLERGTVNTEPPMWMFRAVAVYDFYQGRQRQRDGYATGEVFYVIAQDGECWLAINEGDPKMKTACIWGKHFTRLVQ
ncbi:hypothetical protein PV04_08692 [Phialophora macrospora]|uniref:SH3 domain-containing protein n=1 Tax=Phialophora macrospora TaxID=1851006 RepID=A0A0D2FUF5_9EURO|nr:hypothetical protein PV04_08692 [Phialophora macrospora]